MVPACCPARPVVPPEFPLAPITPELAGVRRCGGNAAGASGLVCRTRHFCARASFACRANQAADGDSLVALAPAARALVGPLAPWPDTLAPTGRGGSGAAAALAGQHLEQTVALDRRAAPVHRNRPARLWRLAV